jgi:hypothetical protein
MVDIISIMIAQAENHPLLLLIRKKTSLQICLVSR